MEKFRILLGNDIPVQDSRRSASHAGRKTIPLVFCMRATGTILGKGHQAFTSSLDLCYNALQMERSKA